MNMNMNKLNIKLDASCIESIESEENNNKYLLSSIDTSKTHTLVLDIDETLLSVRRWIDEIQINDKVTYNKTNKLLKVIKITKEVTLQYDDGNINIYTFYFNTKNPFGQLSSSLDVGDRMDIGGRLASVVKYIFFILFFLFIFCKFMHETNICL